MGTGNIDPLLLQKYGDPGSPEPDGSTNSDIEERIRDIAERPKPSDQAARSERIQALFHAHKVVDVQVEL